MLGCKGTCSFQAPHHTQSRLHTHTHAHTCTHSPPPSLTCVTHLVVPALRGCPDQRVVLAAVAAPRPDRRSRRPSMASSAAATATTTLSSAGILSAVLGLAGFLQPHPTAASSRGRTHASGSAQVHAYGVLACLCNLCEYRSACLRMCSTFVCERVCAEVCVCEWLHAYLFACSCAWCVWCVGCVDCACVI